MISLTLTTYRGKTLLTAALAVLFSINIYADVFSQDDIQLWLKQTVTPSEQSADSTVFNNNNTTVLNGSRYLEGLAVDNSYNHNFTESTTTVAKARERKLLQELSDQLKINLFEHNNKYSSHQLYVNILKQELVGKSRIGQLKYEIRVTQKRAEANFRYVF